MLGADPYENICVILRGSGLFTSHSVAHLETYSLSDTMDKKTQDKEARRQKALVKIAGIISAVVVERSCPENAQNPAAAATASDNSPHGPSGDATYAQMYGALDARAVATQRGEDEFDVQEVSYFDEGAIDSSE
jgi:hypothetical protein